MTIPHGTIVIPSGEQPRFHAFTVSLMKLLEYTPATVRWNAGPDIAFNCNDAIRRRVGEWVWIIGDDHTFAPNVIEHLWNGGFDVVVPLVLQRSHPHRTVLYNADGSPCEFDPTSRKPFPVGLAGSAGMLVREHVLTAIGDPWFRIAGTERQSEDIGFCQAVARAGFRIYCDPDVALGHIATVEVWPDRNVETGTLRVAYRQPNMARLR